MHAVNGSGHKYSKICHVLYSVKYTSEVVRSAKSLRVPPDDESDYGEGGSLSTFLDAPAKVTPRSSVSPSVYCTSP